jgi:hypothetical protein
MRAILVSLLASAAMCRPAAAQHRPNFSGTWKLDVAKSDVQEPRLRVAIFKIDHREPEFTIERTLLYGNDREQMKFDLRTDGRTVVTPYGEEKLALQLRWDDGGLVCSIRDVEDARKNGDTVKYSLSPDGTLLTVTGAAGAKPRVWVFQKE